MYIFLYKGINGEMWNIIMSECTRVKKSHTSEHKVQKS